MLRVQESWRKEIEEHLERLRVDGFGVPRSQEDEVLVEQREEELRSALVEILDKFT